MRRSFFAARPLPWLALARRAYVLAFRFQLRRTADAGPPLAPWTTRADVFVSGHDVSNTDCRTGICRHNENVDMIQFGGADYLVHRTAYSQTLGPNSSLWIYKSTDNGATFPKVSPPFKRRPIATCVIRPFLR